MNRKLSNVEWKHNFPFPHYLQQTDMGCGPACLRMVAEWARNEPSTEWYWIRTSAKTRRNWWTSQSGMYRQGVVRALEHLRDALGAPIEIEPWWKGDGPTRPQDLPTAGEGTIHLVSLDSFLPTGENPGHWIIVVDLFRARDGEAIAVCADPGFDVPYSQRWNSLLAAQVQDIVTVRWVG
jgi:hypothetical protein